MRVLAFLASVLLALCAGAACVEGVTPDCSNPSVCAPIEGDAPADATAETSAPAPDTGTPAPTPDASDASVARDAADAADADGG